MSNEAIIFTDGACLGGHPENERVDRLANWEAVRAAAGGETDQRSAEAAIA